MNGIEEHVRGDEHQRTTERHGGHIIADSQRDAIRVCPTSLPEPFHESQFALRHRRSVAQAAVPARELLPHAHAAGRPLAAIPVQHVTGAEVIVHIILDSVARRAQC